MQLILGCTSLNLKEDILKLYDSKKVADILTLARAAEAAREQAMAIESSEPTLMIKTEPIAVVDKRKSRTTGNKSCKKMNDEMNCFNCGKEYPYDNDKGGPTKNKEYQECNK